MQLDYLHEGSADCPLLRWFDFSPTEVCAFRDLLVRLAKDADPTAVHDLPFIRPLGGCRLILSGGAWDQGVMCGADGAFRCQLTTSTWEDDVGLLEPFCEEGSGYQWRPCGSGTVRLLFSRDGTW